MDREHYMRAALELAETAASQGEVPVGCVITDADGRIIGTGYNRRETDKNAAAHAEIEAIAMACREKGDWRLSDCTMYVTLEPCPMCAGAVINSRLGTVCFGARESVMGSCGSVIDLFMENYGHRPRVIPGILGDECAGILKDFFKDLRK